MLSNEDKYQLKTKRLSLQIIEADDIGFIHQALSDERVTRYYAVHFHTIEETQEQMDWYESLLKEKTGIWWKLVEHQTNKKIGACGYNNWDHKKQAAEIGFWLLPDYHRKGWMSESLPEILRYGFEEMGLKKIVAEVERHNVKSRKLLQANGFEIKPDKAFKEEKNGANIRVDIFERKAGRSR